MLEWWSQCSALLKLGFVLLVVVAAYILNEVYRFLSDPLRDVPGPFLARFTRLWELHQVRKSNFEDLNIELHEQYGPIVRLAPGRYSINDAAATKVIYGMTSRFPKSSFYYPFGSPDLDTADMFNSLDIAFHSQKRRKVANLYSMTSLLSYEQYVDNQNAVLCEKLRSVAASKTVLDIFNWMQYYAFDVIGEITVGESFGFMQAGHDSIGILKAIHDGSVYGSRVGLLSEVHYYAGIMVKTFKLEIPFEAVARFIDKNIALRQNDEKLSDREDFLSKLLTLRKADKIGDYDIMTTMGANIAAGSDTTAISLSSVVYFLTQHPGCLAKLRGEIDACAAEGTISNPVTYQEAQKMPYLQAVIKETLRLHPATGQPLPRVVPPGGTTLLDRFVPGGSVVGVNPWVLHRNADIYGPDADQFKPERWLDASPEQKTLMESNFLSFGIGTRTCIGKNISLLEMTKVIPQIYRQFDLTLPEGGKYSKENVWFVKPSFEVRVALRKA